MNFNRAFRNQATRLSRKVKTKTACQLACKKLLETLRKLHAGRFLKHIRYINSLQIKNKDDFGEGCLTKGSEPFFYDAVYKHCFQPHKLIIDRKEQSIVAQTVLPSNHEYVCNKPIDDCGKVHISDELGNGWGCSFACKTISENDVKIMLE